MFDLKQMDQRLVVFGSLFTVANRLQVLMDQRMDDLTAKQWFVLMMMGFYDHDPSLIEMAKVCDTSYQNIKQIVIKLEKKGYLLLQEDSKDKRIKRLIATEKVDLWEQKNSPMAQQFVHQMFETFSIDEIEQLSQLLQRLYASLGAMENE